MLIFKLGWSRMVLWLRLPLEDISAPLFPPSFPQLFPISWVPLLNGWQLADIHPRLLNCALNGSCLSSQSHQSFRSKDCYGADSLPNAYDYQCSLSSAPWLETFPADETSVSTIGIPRPLRLRKLDYNPASSQHGTRTAPSCRNCSQIYDIVA